MRRDDARNRPLQRRIQRRLDPARMVGLDRREHPLDEVRRDERRRIVAKAQSLGLRRVRIDF